MNLTRSILMTATGLFCFPQKISRRIRGRRHDKILKRLLGSRSRAETTPMGVRESCGRWNHAFPGLTIVETYNADGPRSYRLVGKGVREIVYPDDAYFGRIRKILELRAD